MEEDEEEEAPEKNLSKLYLELNLKFIEQEQDVSREEFEQILIRNLIRNSNERGMKPPEKILS